MPSLTLVAADQWRWVQAALAAVHVDEPPDWPRSAACTASSPTSPARRVELARAVAIAEAGEVEAALALVERLELYRYHYLHATRAEVLRRLDRVEDARAAHERRWSAFTRTPSAASSSHSSRSFKVERVDFPRPGPELERRSR